MMKKRLISALIALGGFMWLADAAWQRWGMDDGERIRLIAGEELPQARVLRSICDDGCWAVFFELPEAEAEALWQRVTAKNGGYHRLDSMFTFGIGDEELNELTGSCVLLPSVGDGACRYLARVEDGRTIIAIKAHYGI